ncbi:uncharacterized protein LOC136020330 [Lathamus discolor]|uniref:uncharacterized protein LOC136020330 n=1 Tax=Lathamus discolor TaxID=678569 RepID=UPI0032B82302
MEVAVDLYLAVPLLFTVLALVLASVFVRLRGAEGERPPEPVGLKWPGRAAPGTRRRRERGWRPVARREWLLVQEVRAVEEWKEAAAEQREEAAEELSPAAEPCPVVAESISRQPPADSREPEPWEDAESKIPPLGASAGSSFGHPGQVEDAGDHAALPSKAEEEDLDSEKQKQAQQLHQPQGQVQQHRTERKIKKNAAPTG